MIYLFCDQSNLNQPEEDFKEFINTFFDKETAASNIQNSTKKDKDNSENENCKPEDVEITEEITSNKTDNDKPRILFEYYFSHIDSNDRLEKNFKNNPDIPSNLYITSGMSAKLDFDDQVSQVY